MYRQLVRAIVLRHLSPIATDCRVIRRSSYQDDPSIHHKLLSGSLLNRTDGSSGSAGRASGAKEDMGFAFCSPSVPTNTVEGME